MLDSDLLATKRRFTRVQFFFFFFLFFHYKAYKKIRYIHFIFFFFSSITLHEQPSFFVKQ